MPDNGCAKCWSSNHWEAKAPNKKGKRRFANKKTEEGEEQKGCLATSEILRGAVVAQAF
jgi:hypothetical protein